LRARYRANLPNWFDHLVEALDITNFRSKPVNHKNMGAGVPLRARYRAN